jgi:putative SOS response-associated peptidase YedK
MPPPNAPQSSRSLPPTPNELVVDIRDRMPVILATKDYARWLGDEPNPGNLMRPFPADLMACGRLRRRSRSPRTMTYRF